MGLGDQFKSTLRLYPENSILSVTSSQYPSRLVYWDDVVSGFFWLALLLGLKLLSICKEAT